MNSLVKRFSVSAEEMEGKRLVRPSQLPFYDETPQPRFELVNQEPGLLEQNIKVVRQQVVSVAGQIQEAGDKVNEVYEIGKAHTQGTYNQLLAEENLPIRIGVIAGSGLLGLLIGRLRGGLVKRLVYTTLGTGAGAAVCYPTEAAQLSEEAYVEGRKKAMIAYNFVAGVESAESNPDVQSNLIASSISRVSAYSLRLVRDLKESLTGPASPPPQGTGKQTETVAAKKQEKVVFIAQSKEEAAVVKVEGDPGQGREEDRDLYTTRSS